MKRKIVKVGGSLAIIIGALEYRMIKLNEGDLVEIDIRKVEDGKNKKK